jgi:hypothetical protein
VRSENAEREKGAKHFKRRARATTVEGRRLLQIVFAQVARQLIGRACRQA